MKLLQRRRFLLRGMALGATLPLGACNYEDPQRPDLAQVIRDAQAPAIRRGREHRSVRRAQSENNLRHVPPRQSWYRGTPSVMSSSLHNKMCSPGYARGAARLRNRMPEVQFFHVPLSIKFVAATVDPSTLHGSTSCGSSR